MVNNRRLVVGATILAFWTVSISLTLYFKWTFSRYGFHFPVTVVVSTFIIEWTIVFLSLAFQYLAFDTSPLLLDKRGIKYAVPIGVLTAVEVTASNLSLLTISVSFHTMVKSSVPLFVLIFSVMTGLQKAQCWQGITVVMISVGIMLTSAGEREKGNGEFSWEGFLYVVLAATAGGLRWTLSQFLLHGHTTENESLEANRSGAPSASPAEPTKPTPFVLLLYVLPSSALSLPPAFFFLEQDDLLDYLGEPEHATEDAMAKLVGIIVGCAVLALLLIYLQLQLVVLTSSLTFSICAVCKELILIAVATVVFGDSISPLNAAGFFICLVGVALYKKEKIQEGPSTKISGGSTEQREGYDSHSFSPFQRWCAWLQHLCTDEQDSVRYQRVEMSSFRPHLEATEGT